MRHSTDRILTTHTGSLPRPPELAAALIRRDAGEPVEDLAAMVRGAVAAVVRRQLETGLDLVSDGEMSKITFSTYVKERLTGFGGEQAPRFKFADLFDYPGVLQRVLGDAVPVQLPTCVAPVTYVGRLELEQDLANLTDALKGASTAAAFVPAASPATICYTLQDRYYGDDDSYLAALAAAMREEYEAIVAAGFLLQVDCPDLAGGRHTRYADLSLAQFRGRITKHVEALNEALRDIPPERVRLHLCWGNYAGPHHRDVELRNILDVVLSARAHAVVLEAANPRHAHEWRVFEEVRLPDDKVLVPGVIDTGTNYIEHPELVAERITRFASVVGRERVIAGTDCGFASYSTHLPVVPEIGWAKLASLVEGARLASARLWP